ncbi:MULTISPECIES: DEAD/DEAH box helicase [unclassified Lentimicrobium]|uniref:DEAD/DEAH box helicase n=1 Tax=unclassified Lentimicrobium TaxID=2677434 RepID=UPI00155780FB|nr:MULTISPECIES: DEAD/DEAH box helicase [unclassified Lentimicrobium]NPD45961.1 DEAD/DEAH box helicase [Lentimicrobium sp. S6]NPD84272.1 DEAD/DEAH box helicase [Lentimicrobium sp. L6]
MFKDLKLSGDILDAIDAMGYKDATPIQEQSIPIILEGSDLMAFAQTGTGKTAAFLLPMVDILLDYADEAYTKALIIAPTRELAGQIDQQLQGMAYYTPIDSLAIYGGGDGKDFSQEKKALERGASIIIATPGRFLSHLKMGYVDLSKLEFLVLDEADKMLDMGFLPDILEIKKQLSGKQQNLLFSATMNPKIRTLAKSLLNNPKEINIAMSKPAEGVIQAAYLVHDSEKIRLLKHLLKDKTEQKMIVFAGSKITVDNIAKNLKDLKLGVQAFHSGFDQKDREEIMLNFRSGKTKVLIATDIVSRGIDVDDIDLILNFESPSDAEDYVHRVGRTARAKRSGLAISLINSDDVYKFQQIEKLIDRVIHKIPLPADFPAGPEYTSKGGGRKFSPKGKFNKKPGNKKFNKKPNIKKD